MAKATSLTPDALSVPGSTPPAAMRPRTAAGKAAKSTNDTALQIHVPKLEARAIKVAAVHADQSISEFMLSCFHAYMGGKA